MQYYDDTADVAQGFGPSAVTIGKFDGVHVGHRAVIAHLERAAREHGLVSTVVTFDRHPLDVIDPDKVPPALTSIAQRRELLDDVGVDATLLLRFDHELQSKAPEAFVSEILVDTLHAQLVFVGSDFRFGAKGAGDVALLRELGEQHGFTVELIDDVDLVDDVRPDGERRVSSTWIRELLGDGRVAEAARLLGREHAVRSVVVHGNERGRAMGYPTANLDPASEGFVPADGVYAARVLHDGTVYPAAVSVGNNPTFEGVPAKQIEAHLLDVDIDLYGDTISVLFVSYVRGMVKFDSMDELAEQMRQDDRDIRTLLGLPAVV
ncbi:MULTISPECIES: bifunctional riboflavin kinase/FAD synthetase [unclassified Curtobacterium]|uniref:bifunctional riboflavin kinase/FAD synthetase n=1 Tax=unclassified Curtobacterium TaxID=257496 RepID=UPI00089DE068|nr:MULTISPECIES: bifunctional riboflavin kinase/FAD synthetase [unclassified Curtobacterium]AOX64485.1 riboflavin biosynthesis protein RibF [Curtobacterium sp. BH-2-1-1]MCC8906627.1 bifunctional riboflavin kinase/FAD synthetase [Curtobacterium sp. GD1]MCT9622295.1 bifunctional riboflavin kinase/FAD synthetase [Curtobacterium sp. C2H10]MDR6171813.1 riboflavin kinase/FMN adenylyltransferase [Curtobacterium sp. SORGH_AS_0776]MDR6572906.1 riboflavin kinase/FMN adenylyltransferase [Curtobacterium s